MWEPLLSARPLLFPRFEPMINHESAGKQCAGCRPSTKATFDLKLLEGAKCPAQTRARLPRAPHAQAVSAMARISSSADLAATLAPPPEPPAAEGHGCGADNDDGNDDNTSPPLLDLVERFPDLFAQQVLQHLDPIDRTFLAQVGSACRAAVAASDLPRAGTRRVELGRSVWVVTHQLGELVGSVERLAWAKASGCPWVARICALAARSGSLKVLTWARQHGCPWDTATCSYAAEKGHLDVLMWARKHHCPWNNQTCFWAAASGHLEVLRWAREHGCPWSGVRAMCEIVSWNYPETLAWVRAQPQDECRSHITDTQ